MELGPKKQNCAESSWKIISSRSSCGDASKLYEI
jgi:hypothetical protein